ncbi:MAG: hypothetical protein Q4G69_00850 [Planctomycetia bacterium]|nr:hypothetical protein [Planctomycetia bacterium]
MNWITLEEANLYFSERPWSNHWDSAEIAIKTKCLIWSEKLFKCSFLWSTSAFTVGQNGNEIPHDQIKAALCEQANWLLTHSIESGSDDIPAAIESFSVGSLSARFNNKEKEKWISSLAVQLIGKLGSPIRANSENGSIESSLLEG